MFILKSGLSAADSVSPTSVIYSHL